MSSAAPSRGWSSGRRERVGAEAAGADAGDLGGEGRTDAGFGAQLAVAFGVFVKICGTYSAYVKSRATPSVGSMNTRRNFLDCFAKDLLDLCT